MATAGVPLWSTTAASNSTADPAVNWAEGMAPSAVNDSSRAMMASVAKWRDDLYGLTTGGTSTAFTVTTNATYATAAAMSGNIFTIVPHTTSGAAPTLAVDGLTARALNISTGVAVPTSALVSGTPYLVKYVHASTEFIVLGVIGKDLLTSLDIVNGTALTAPATDDSLAIYDLSATANRKIALSDFFKIINTLTAETSPATDDVIPIYDTSETAANSMTLANLFKTTNVLTEDTSPDASADFHLMYDTSAGAAKKVKPSSLGIPGMVLIKVQTASSSTSLDFVNGVSSVVFDSTYDTYVFEFINLLPATDDRPLIARVGTGGTPTYLTSGYHYATWDLLGAGASSTSGSGLFLNRPTGSFVSSSNVSADGGVSGTFKITTPTATIVHPAWWQVSFVRADGTSTGCSGAGSDFQTTALTAVRFMFDSGNITSGSIAMYGLKKS